VLKNERKMGFLLAKVAFEMNIVDWAEVSLMIDALYLFTSVT